MTCEVKEITAFLQKVEAADLGYLPKCEKEIELAKFLRDKPNPHVHWYDPMPCRTTDKVRITEEGRRLLAAIDEPTKTVRTYFFDLVLKVDYWQAADNAIKYHASQTKEGFNQ